MSNIALVVIDMQEKFKGLVSYEKKEDWEVQEKEIYKIILQSSHFDVDLYIIGYKDMGKTVTRIKTAAKLHPNYQHDFPLKDNFSAFQETDLMQRLNQKNRKRIIITGVNTHACILKTIEDGVNNGLLFYTTEGLTKDYTSEWNMSVDELKERFPDENVNLFKNNKELFNYFFLQTNIQ